MKKSQLTIPTSLQMKMWLPEKKKIYYLYINIYIIYLLLSYHRKQENATEIYKYNIIPRQVLLAQFYSSFFSAYDQFLIDKRVYQKLIIFLHKKNFWVQI